MPVNPAAGSFAHDPPMRLLLALVLSLYGAVASAAAPVLIALDAEFGIRTSTSAQAVQQGIELALAEINAAGGCSAGGPCAS